LGWTNGRNLRIDTRFTAPDAERIRRFAAELVALMPDAILATSAVTTRALQQSSRTIPIIFTATSDPVGEGLVASLARPGGNTSGFAMIEYNISVKWLELLKEIAPGVTRAAVIRDPTLTASAGQYGAMLGVAASLRVELTPIDSRAMSVRLSGASLPSRADRTEASL
jgi:putative ABC transport system substrate-binding protein